MRHASPATHRRRWPAGEGSAAMTGAAPPGDPAGAMPGRSPWPVRSGTVPALADDYASLPETAPGLAAALLAEPRSRWSPAGRRPPARCPARLRRTGAGRRARPSSLRPLPSRCGSRACWTCWSGSRRRAGPAFCPATPRRWPPPPAAVRRSVASQSPPSSSAGWARPAVHGWSTMTWAIQPKWTACGQPAGPAGLGDRRRWRRHPPRYAGPAGRAVQLARGPRLPDGPAAANPSQRLGAIDLVSVTDFMLR